MPRNRSNKQCYNCQAVGHLKNACPLLIDTVHVGASSVSQEQNKPSISNKKTQKYSKEPGCKVLFLTEQNPMYAYVHECDLCDEYGHYEYDCPLYLKAVKEQEEYGKNWIQKWGRKIQKNKLLLESMSKQSETGLQCQYCYSIHHNTEVCFLVPYGIKEELKL